MDGADAEYRRAAAEALDADDWHGAYLAAKGWIGHGGAGLLDPWLVYVASALLHGQPRTAVHSLDLALRGWFKADPDRAILHFVRARVVFHRLGDPKTALLDLAASQPHAPTWLADEVRAEEIPMREAASTSRKRKPCVEPAPAFSGVGENLADLGMRRRVSGLRPELWGVVDAYVHDRGA